MGRLLKLAVIASAAWGTWSSWSGRALEQSPGVLVPEAPLQQQLADARAFMIGESRVEPRARYEIRARLLHSERYLTGREAAFSPFDFALGWGPMSDTAVLDTLDISQSGRFFWVHWRDPPLPAEVIMEHAANTHIVPADAAVRRVLEGFRPGQVIVLRGYLVDITTPDGWAWKSSLSRADVGNGACELLWVESAALDRG